MQVGVHVTCMHINFDGCRHSGFGDIATFKNGQISLSTMDYKSMVIKKFNQLESAKKFMQVGVHVTCMHINFDGCRHSSFRDIATFKNGQISLSTMDYSSWSSKNLITWNRLKKFMQVGVHVTCMHINFVGCRHSGFGDIATFKNGQISLSDHGL